MKMRAISLLVLTLIFAAAPAALASNCLRCNRVTQQCYTVTAHGYELCGWDIWGICYTQDACGGIGLAATAPLASEYQVASVERLDEAPQPKAEEVLVASNETDR